MLMDGRELIIARDFAEAREVDKRWPDINGAPAAVGEVKRLREDFRKIRKLTDDLEIAEICDAALAP